jgi:hypothetical protein
MIAKGTQHANGAVLGRYMITGKGLERAELVELRGFADTDIVLAFLSIHVMAAATQCEQPFFHCQIRNPEGEHLTREQWQRVADRIEHKLGLDDQQRAIAFHELHGQKHMHVAWSRIDGETLKAKNLPFFKLRLKEVCRELEIELGLTRVRNERTPDEPRAPKRAEEEQARRLDLDPKALRAEIRAAWEASHNGKTLTKALHDRGFSFARGDRRDFVVIDEAGGVHALGKRLVGQTAAEIRQRLSDLDRDTMPTVEAARLQQAQLRHHPAEPEAPKPRIDIGAIGASGGAAAAFAAGGPPDQRVKINAQPKEEGPASAPPLEIDKIQAPTHAAPRVEFFEDGAAELAERHRPADVAAAVERKIQGMETEQDRKDAERADLLRRLEEKFADHERERERER